MSKFRLNACRNNYGDLASAILKWCEFLALFWFMSAIIGVAQGGVSDV